MSKTYSPVVSLAQKEIEDGNNKIYEKNHSGIALSLASISKWKKRSEYEHAKSDQAKNEKVKLNSEIFK